MYKKDEKHCPVCTFLLPGTALQCSMCLAELKEEISTENAHTIRKPPGNIPVESKSQNWNGAKDRPRKPVKLLPVQRSFRQLPPREETCEMSVDEDSPRILPKTRPPSLPFFNRKKIAEVVSDSQAKRKCSPEPQVPRQKRRIGTYLHPNSMQEQKIVGTRTMSLVLTPPSKMKCNSGMMKPMYVENNSSVAVKREKPPPPDYEMKRSLAHKPDPFGSINLSGFYENSDKEEEDEESEIWACAVCTFHNQRGVKRCDICGCPAGSSTQSLTEFASAHQTPGGPGPIIKPNPSGKEPKKRKNKGKRRVTFMSSSGGSPLSSRRTRKKSSTLPVPYKNILAHPTEKIIFDKPHDWKRKRKPSVKRKHIINEAKKRYKKNKRTLLGKLKKAKLELEELMAEQENLIRCKEAAETDFNRNFSIAEEFRKEVEELQLQLKAKEKVYKEKFNIAEDSEKFKASSILRVEAKNVQIKETQSKIDRLEKMFDDLKVKKDQVRNSLKQPFGKDGNPATRHSKPSAPGKIVQVNHNHAKSGSSIESKNKKPPRPSAKRRQKSKSKTDMKLDKIRNWVGKSLLQIFGVSSLAQNIEHAIGEACEWDVNQYAPRARDVMFNLRQNNDLKNNLMEGNLAPDILVSMTNEQLASKKLKAKRTEVKKYNMTAHLLNPYEKEANTNEYKCEKCGSNECIFKLLQMDRGDEPLEVFVTCIKCQNHWRVDQ